MTILVREAPPAGRTAAAPDQNRYTAATLRASGRQDGAELSITLAGQHPDLRPARVKYGGVDIGGDWVTTSSKIINRNGKWSTSIVMRPALSRRPGSLLRQLHARLETMLSAEYRITPDAQNDYLAASTSAIGYWGYLLTGANAPAADVSRAAIVQTLRGMIEESTLADQERYDDAARALWGDWMLLVRGQLLQRWGLRSVLSPVSAHRTAQQIAALPAPLWLTYERGNDMTYDPAVDTILVPVRVGSDNRGITWLSALPPETGDQAWLVHPGSAARVRLATPDDAGYRDSYVVRGVKDGIRQAQLAGYLQAQRLQLPGRTVDVTIKAPATAEALLKHLPGEAIKINNTPMWIVDITVDDLARTARLTLVDPS